MSYINIGDKFGKLTVLECVSGDKAETREWRCKCDCGNTVVAKEKYLKNGHRKSCGCLYGISSTKHGETKTRLHKVWESMLARCEYQKHPHFKSYGGRGISVCKEWHEYENFRDWALQNEYSDTLTLDRINVNGNYEPSNCRFATMKQQQNNKRTNHIVSINGVSMTISECSEEFGIPKSTVRYRATHNYPILERQRLYTRCSDGRR